MSARETTASGASGLTRPRPFAPQVERLPTSRINEAMKRLESGQARYRIVLDADFGEAR